MTEKTAEQETESKPVDNKTQETKTTVEDTVIEQDSATTTLQQQSEDTPESAADDSHAEVADPTAGSEPLLTEDDFDNEAIVPGSLSRALKRCRDKADLTLEQAAQEMRLPLGVIRAMEEENFADLPEAPYVRGYLRSYARLSESDPNPLINRFEILRGADPNEITAVSSPIVRNTAKSAKKEVSPTTIKLAGFSMIVLLLVVLSMIPAVSQWASDTWKAFSEPQQQQLATAETDQGTTLDSNADADTPATDTDEQDTPATTDADSATETARQETAAKPAAASNNDMATIQNDSSEQLALNQQEKPAGAEDNSEATAGDTDSPTDNTDSSADTAAPSQDNAEQTGTNDSGQDDADTAAAGQEAATTSDAATTAQNDDTENAAETTADAAANTENTSAQTTAGAQENGATDDSDTTAETANTNNNTNSGETDATQLEQAQQDGDTAVEETQRQAEQAAAEKKTEEEKREAEQARQQNDRFRQPFDGNVLIRLVFSQPVWMSIKDGKGKTIFGALNSAGTVKELQARTPLQFHVGNAPGVKIYLNGQLVDQRPHTRGSVARFRAN